MALPPPPTPFPLPPRQPRRRIKRSVKRSVLRDVLDELAMAVAGGTAHTSRQFGDIDDDTASIIGDDHSETVEKRPKKVDSVNDLLHAIGRKLLDLENAENVSQVPPPEIPISLDGAIVGQIPAACADGEERIFYTDYIHDPQDGGWICCAVQTNDSDEPGLGSIDYAMICKRDQMSKELLEISVIGKDLKGLLEEALRHYPGHWDERMTFVDAGLVFSPLIHNWDALQQLALECATDENGRLARQDLQILLSKIQKTNRCGKYFAEREMIRREKVISFEWLWTIFPPGSIVYLTESAQPEVLLVSSSVYRVRKRRLRGFMRYSSDPASDYEDELIKPVDFLLFCWGYDFYGAQFNRRPITLKIREFQGTKKVLALTCCPLDMIPHHENIRRSLIARGNWFRQLNIKDSTEQRISHAGQFYRYRYDEEISYPLGARSDQHIRLEEYTGRIMVDVKAFRKYAPHLLKRHLEKKDLGDWVLAECACTKCLANAPLTRTFGRDYDKVTPNADGIWPEFEERQLMLCPPKVLGYALDKKLWAQMLVDNVKEIETGPDEEAFDNLVLSDDNEQDNTKFLIKSLVKYHLSSRSNSARGGIAGLEDFIVGKGKGLVILLHGTSGTGKTLTVECVTQMTGKPLLKISVADVGVKVKDVEEKLTNYFELATAWDAVLLIDEADILLESRSLEAGTLDRNAMVSVFLKILEYYEGILLLTTNRVKSIDIAVESRIHLAVHFAPMTKEDQRKLFKIFLNRIAERDIENKTELENWCDKYFKEEFNGRDIRNMFSSALAIARAENSKLKKRHIEILREVKKASQKTFAEQRTIARADKGFE